MGIVNMKESPVKTNLSSSCVVSQATPQDIPELLAMIQALARYEKLEDQCVSTEADLQRALFSAKPEAEALIARIEGKAAGFALFCHNFSTFLGRHGLWLEDLFVHENCRGHGIGKKLLAALAGIAKQRRCGRLEWAVLDWNTPAIDFYQSRGATVMGDWRIVRTTGEALDTLAAMSDA